ncbi:MAG: NYN domain-containing protein [Phascolarctobacterium sp.]|nr:NYN domain-containing protein [Phascolarctobacterium sp.]MBQ7020841.1 NYN domain-containing protein [Phascolarctobacterium sp.]
MVEYLIVDGYNVINAWKEFAKLREDSLEHAREILVANISEYAAFKGQKGIVVFDAQEAQGDGSVTKIHGVEVVFTNEGETADAWIERRAYELRHARDKVFVVTSDYAEQMNVLGAGAYRISAREFHEDYKNAKKAIAEKLRQPASGLNRNELGGRLADDVLAQFEKLRRK